MTLGKYILEGKEPRPCHDLAEWAQWMEKGNRIVKQDQLGEVRVSTVFLGMDHSWSGTTPILFETMIFGGDHDEYQERYATWAEAEEGHKRALEMVQSQLGGKQP